jgi:hypothetical protein
MRYLDLRVDHFRKELQSRTRLGRLGIGGLLAGAVSPAWSQPFRIAHCGAFGRQPGRWKDVYSLADESALKRSRGDKAAYQTSQEAPE